MNTLYLTLNSRWYGLWFENGHGDLVRVRLRETKHGKHLAAAKPSSRNQSFYYFLWLAVIYSQLNKICFIISVPNHRITAFYAMLNVIFFPTTTGNMIQLRCNVMDMQRAIPRQWKVS